MVFAQARVARDLVMVGRKIKLHVQNQRRGIFDFDLIMTKGENIMAFFFFCTASLRHTKLIRNLQYHEDKIIKRDEMIS